MTSPVEAGHVRPPWRPNLEPVEDECPPFWWDTYPPGATEHELYEARPIPPDPFTKPADADAAPFAGHWMAWLPRCAPQIIELKTDKYNPTNPDDPRRTLKYTGQYNTRNPLPMRFHMALPDPGWWYPSPSGIYVYFPYSAAWDVKVSQFKGTAAETMSAAGSFGRPTAIFRRMDSTQVPTVGLTPNPATLSLEVGKSATVRLDGKITVDGQETPFDATPFAVFTVDKPDIATVTSRGLVHGVKAGSATVTLTTGTDHADQTVAVTVTAPPA